MLKQYLKLNNIILVLILMLFHIYITFNANASENVTLRFMNTMNDEENETLFELIKEYNQKNPNVKIQLENVSFYDAKNYVEEKFKQNNLPDILRVEIRLVLSYAKQKIIAPIDEFITTNDYTDYLSYLYKYCILDGKHIYGVPQVVDCLVLFYNKNHFKNAKILNAPKNINEFLEFAKKLTIDSDGNTSDSTFFNQYKILQYGFAIHYDSYYLLPFIFSFGGNLCDEFGNSLIKSEQTKSALKFIYELKNKFHVVPQKIDPKFGHDFALMEFMDGNISMIIDGPWNIKKILKGNAFKDQNNLGIALIPKMITSSSPLGGQYFCISSSCKNKKIAYDFINFINSKDAQIKFSKLNYLVPTRKSALNEIKISHNEFEMKIRDTLLEQVKLAALYAHNIPDPTYLYELDQALTLLLDGKVGFDETLNNLDEKFKQIAATKK